MQKFSKLLCNTLKEVPNDAVIPSHQLMLRSGLVQKSGSGLYNLLPLGLRVIQKVENIIREELNKVGCQEINMSVVTPSELWKESFRWDELGDLMLKFTDRSGRESCVSPTNEEAVVDLFRKQVNSYKSLPLTLYQINTKFRDEIRPRFGLMRCREFVMKDAYSFHENKLCLDKTYDQIHSAYESIFKKMGLDFMVVEADAGAMGGSDSKTHEFQVIANSGEDEVVISKEANYAANIEKAMTQRQPLDFDESLDNLTEVSTPNQKTMEELSVFLNKPLHHLLKSLIYISVKGEKRDLVQVVLLGDDNLNEIKLKNHLSVDEIYPATDSELEKSGLVKGFIGPKGTPIKCFVDKSVSATSAYVVGANKQGCHFLNFIPDRDGKMSPVDLRLAKEGDLVNGATVSIKRGIEVGHIFQLGDKYTKLMSATILNSEGKSVAPLMGCYGIGVGRTAAAAIEQSHDEKGIIWPKAIAPYHISIIIAAKNNPEINQLAEDIATECEALGLECIIDDRDVGIGFKFNDYELIGFPSAIVLGKKWINDKEIEVKMRRSGETLTLTRDTISDRLLELIK
ncbi:proline--tRNA ligase [Candidatus Marinamargulisbacteria bacterium SCGC AAA071-K20]|nr:proline--tRNA ligase [Candidatus Marinamargulisbacteria bacterium SCGC AAA071-K20]